MTMTIIRIIILILAAALAWASWREAERDATRHG